jgi:hypothetical protein
MTKKVKFGINDYEKKIFNIVFDFWRGGVRAGGAGACRA